MFSNGTYSSAKPVGNARRNRKRDEGHRESDERRDQLRRTRDDVAEDPIAGSRSALISKSRASPSSPQQPSRASSSDRLSGMRGAYRFTNQLRSLVLLVRSNPTAPSGLYPISKSALWQHTVGEEERVMHSRSEHSGGKAPIAIPKVQRDLNCRDVLFSFDAAIAAFTLTGTPPSDLANTQAQKRARPPVPAREQPAARFQPALPVAIFLGLVVMTAPVLAAPATNLPALAPLIADQADSIEPASTSGWKCVRRGHCWVPCRGDMCRKACFRTWWSCSVR